MPEQSLSKYFCLIVLLHPQTAASASGSNDRICVSSARKAQVIYHMKIIIFSGLAYFS